MYNGENPLVIGASAVWEDLNCTCPWEIITNDDLLTFAYEHNLPGRILGETISARHFDEDEAWYLYEQLPEDLQAELAESYISLHGLRKRLKAWKENNPD